ncbi:D-alanyl-D-alanine carboxypeptidase/D-alanyl-D-alanine endopeptidase [Virgibacillus flavescens]|uniref:D-alanyl-D-alanine carboxypeptidase/D-alanyl-D-alanine endopeptidase n=1 Tax=Virgibacillus flavescens TaxID=1611422 RepID=UPI003D34E67E
MKIAKILIAVLVVISVVFLVEIYPYDEGNTPEKVATEVKEDKVVNKPANQAGETTKTDKLQEQLDKYIKNEPHLNGATIGVSVRSAATGELIYEHNGEKRMHPASNMKLLTGAAALSSLGRDHTFTTEILAGGQIINHSLQGDLYIKGMGDPTLVTTNFKDFAKKVSAKGIKQISGDIIADDTWYDDVRVSPDLIWTDEQYYYGAQISALTASPNSDYDAGSVQIDVSPGKSVGVKPIVSETPRTDYVNVINNAETVAAGEEEDIEVGRKHGSNIITIEGTIPIDSWTVKEWMAVWEPTGYALDLFKQALASQGITWTGELKVGKAPESATVLVKHESMPLAKLMLPFMKLSNNVHAEVLVKEMGKVVKGEGSWEKGLEVIDEEMLKLGLDIETIKLRDGSGISGVSLIPPNQISKLLYEVQKRDWYSTFNHSLPVAAAEDRMVGGTLRNRMKEISNYATIQAKTGTINSVSSLSGYINTRESETIIFSILNNNLLDEDDGKEIEDKIVEILAKP